ncbi:MAG: mechanosensitive ion channel domain-containing protein [Bacteroidota bacterium]
MQILPIILVFISLWVLLKAIPYFARITFSRQTHYAFFLKIFPWLEAAVWTAALFWSLQKSVKDEQLLVILNSILAIVLIILIAWFVLRDFIAGVSLRASQMLDTGIKIKITNTEGIITSIGFFTLEIQNNEGEKIRIPYHQLFGQQFIRQPEKGYGKTQSMQTVISQKWGAQNIQQGLQKKLLELPWILPHEDMKIKLLPKDDIYEVELVFIIIKDDMRAKTEECIRSFVRDHFPA